MAINVGFLNLASNLGLDLDVIILIIIVLGSLLFFAKDFKIGAIMLFLTSGVCFMGFYYFQLNYVPALVIFFMSLISMAFSYYAVDKTASMGGVV